MSSVTAYALVTVIQAIADGGQTILLHHHSTTLAPAIGSIVAAIAKLLLGNNADLVGTNADLVGLPPRSVLYKGFPYEIPDLSAEGPFYCVIKGKHIGVLSTWEDTSPQVTGVSGAIHSHCSSVELFILAFTGIQTQISLNTQHLFNTPSMGWQKLHKSKKECQEAAKRYRKVYYEKYELQIKFCRLVNGSIHRFLDDLVLQYMGSTRSEDTQQPIMDVLDIAQEAEELVTRSGGDCVQCQQVTLFLEDILLHVFEDDDITSAHN
ncbi:hypothetical protein BD769DRAFT_1388945 [Suillus cothurnatus]|nr:hypothetical protein BD769DRAFT_1388945 [Suillus cothurnatus]